MNNKVKMTLMYIFLGICTVISVFPLLWMIIAATNKSVDVIAGKLTFGSYLMENYRNLISQQPLWGNFLNSCKYTILVTVFSLIVSSLAGYAFEIYRDKAKEKMYAIGVSVGFGSAFTYTSCCVDTSGARFPLAFAVFTTFSFSALSVSNTTS